ncbi:MAG: hypothetical protein ACKVWR_08980 [Acidimicrobiales bacterium]
MDDDPHRPGRAELAGELDRAEAELAAIAAALGRLDDGTYGLCRQCGRRLAEETVAADPLAGSCPEHG